MITVGQLARFERTIDAVRCFSLQRKLASLSSRFVDKRFKDLYNLMYWPPLVRMALHIVRTRPGARTPGVDGKTKDNIKDEKLLAEICAEMKARSYVSGPLRKVDVPKPTGGSRTLSIFNYRDRVVHTMVKLILEPIFEPHFDTSSHGFRPNHSAHDAIAEVKLCIGEKRRYAWAAETDVEKCFDRIVRGRLLAFLEERIADGEMIQAIRKCLQAGAMQGFPTMEDGAECGCPQGSPLSPLLCNIYLDKLDKFVNRALHREQAEREKDRNDLAQNPIAAKRRRGYRASVMRKERTGPFYLIRFADDLVILSPASHENVAAYLETVKKFLWDTLRLKMAPAKTHITHVSDGFNFLGFRIKRIYRKDLQKHIALITVDPTRKERHRSALKQLLCCGHQRETESTIKAVNQRVRGWRNYYQKSVTNCDALHYIDQSAFWRTVKWIAKKYNTTTGRAMKIAYKTITSESGSQIKAIVWGRTHLVRAVEALPKHEFDYSCKPRHPWTKGGTAEEMINKAFPVPIRAPTWDGNTAYGSHFAKTARKALERDGYTCQACGSTEKLEVHHIEQRNAMRYAPATVVHRLENLVTLCKKCHKYANRLSAVECINWLMATD